VIGKAFDRGDLRAAQDVFNRAYGKPIENIEVGGGPKTLDDLVALAFAFKDGSVGAAEIRRPDGMMGGILSSRASLDHPYSFSKACLSAG